MFGAERQQIRSDFGLAPELVRRYIREEAQDDALTMSRQVNGVTTYLSWMATGEPRIVEGTVYAVGIAGMDVVTDFQKWKVSDGLTRSALDGEPEVDDMAPLSLASDLARHPEFDSAVRRLAEWQDRSLAQFGSPDEYRLRRITANKGGYSALAHLYAVSEDVTVEEESLMMQFGETMQLLDDYLDQPGDEEEDISTLFTEGYIDVDDLRRKVDSLETMCEATWGKSRATKRFGRLMRMHIRLGRVENRYPGAAKKLLPWYF